MHTMSSRITDEVSYFADIEPERIRMWCSYCGCNVDTERRDQGIGRYEYQGAKGVHVDMRDTCAVCGYDSLEGARTEDEHA